MPSRINRRVTKSLVPPKNLDEIQVYILRAINEANLKKSFYTSISTRNSTIPSIAKQLSNQWGIEEKAAYGKVGPRVRAMINTQLVEEKPTIQARTGGKSLHQLTKLGEKVLATLDEKQAKKHKKVQTAPPANDAPTPPT